MQLFVLECQIWSEKSTEKSENLSLEKYGILKCSCPYCDFGGFGVSHFLCARVCVCVCVCVCVIGNTMRFKTSLLSPACDCLYSRGS